MRAKLRTHNTVLMLLLLVLAITTCGCQSSSARKLDIKGIEQELHQARQKVKCTVDEAWATRVDPVVKFLFEPEFEGKYEMGRQPTAEQYDRAMLADGLLRMLADVANGL